MKSIMSSLRSVCYDFIRRHISPQDYHTEIMVKVKNDGSAVRSTHWAVEMSEDSLWLFSRTETPVLGDPKPRTLQTSALTQAHKKNKSLENKAMHKSFNSSLFTLKTILLISHIQSTIDKELLKSFNKIII